MASTQVKGHFISNLSGEKSQINSAEWIKQTMGADQP